MAQGTVKWFSNEKGYGFIEREDGEDLFVHFSEIAMDGYKTLTQGQRVEFEIAQSDKGLQASTSCRSRQRPEAERRRPRHRKVPGPSFFFACRRATSSGRSMRAALSRAARPCAVEAGTVVPQCESVVLW